MCPWEQSQVKFFFQNSSTIPYFPPHSEKNSNLGEGLSARLSNCTLLVQKNVFRKNFFVSVKPFYFHQFWNLNKNILEPSSENSENCSNWIVFVEWNVISEVFFFERKNIPINSFWISTRETSKRRIKLLTVFVKLCSTCPEDFNQDKRVFFRKEVFFNRYLFLEFYWKNNGNFT